MKKAAYYARVSSDLQQKERTIDSQIVELKKQIIEAEDVLVKEYVDDGYSGARLDRPALDKLRNDLKTDAFDSIYFLNTDRIARDVTYQNLIIGEILKYKKQIIINGKDYVHNPENKFTLTVLGAVSELERAKIIERMTRGKMHRLNQGQLLGHGYNTFGYTYHRKTHATPAWNEINEEEAKIVRYIFETYANGKVGINQVSKQLEEMGARAREGQKLWGYSRIRFILKNEAYTGIRYFHKQMRVKEVDNPLYKAKYGKKVFRERSEWIGIKIPTIIPRALYDKVQERIKYNLSCYRNPKKPQLLSNLIKCGDCGRSFFAYRRYYKARRNAGLMIYHKAAYACPRRSHDSAHAKSSVRIICRNPQIDARFMDPCVTDVIRATLFNSEELRKHMDFFKKKGQINQAKMERSLLRADQKIKDIEEQKKRILNLYASNMLSQEEYGKRCLEYDNKINELKLERSQLLKKIPLLHKKDEVEVRLAEFCEGARLRFEQCKDFSTYRQFFLDYVDKIIYQKDAFRIYGHVSVGSSESEDLSKIEFCIPAKLDRYGMLARFREEERTGKSLDGKPIVRYEYGQLLLEKTPELETRSHTHKISSSINDVAGIPED